MKFPPRPYQTQAIDGIRQAWRDGKRKIVLVAPTGSGKCLGRGTLVLRHDGQIVPVEDVRPDDLLMGPDSTARRVMSVTEGYGPLYRIVPVKGDPWICNEDHILTLVNTSSGQVSDVPIQAWLGASKWFRHMHKQFMVGVDYGVARELPIDPYFLGLWLGDGTKNTSHLGLTTVAITKPDPEIQAVMRDVAMAWDGVVTCNDSNGTRCPTWRISTTPGQQNPLLIALRSVMGNDLHVPLEYLTGSESQRLELLAGWVDSDGHFANGYFEIAQKNADHARSLAQLARSLGFRVVQRPKVVNGAIYQRLSILGDIDRIPCRIPRKKAPPRRQIKDALRTGIKVVPIAPGPYFGFELDGDGRFLLGDFTVTHNTFMASTIIEGATNKGNRVLFLAHRKELIDQCSKTLDDIGVDHGVIKSGHWRKRPALAVQVASVQTLVSKRKCGACKGTPEDPCAICNDTRWIRRVMPAAQVVVVDETHRCLAPSYQEVFDAYPDALILGLTATPWRLDGRGLGVQYQMLIATVQVAELVEQGYLLPIRAFAPDLPDLSDVRTVRGDYDSGSVSQIMGSDKLVGNIVEHWQRLGEGRRTVVFAASVENSQYLVQRFHDSGVAAEHLDGNTKDPDRDAILGRLESGETTIVCNVDVLVEGYDLPSLGCVVLARPTLSLTRYLQQVGRGMRPHEDQGYMVLIDHAGCVHEHGLPTDPRRWSLEDRRKKKGDSNNVDVRPCVKCESCGSLRPLEIEICPACSGVQVAVFRGLVTETDGKLVEVTSTYQCKSCKSTSVRLEPWRDLEIKIKCRECHETTYDVDRQAAKQATEERRRKEYDRLRAVQAAKGMKPGWVSYRYRDMFGSWPPRVWSETPENYG